VKIKTKLLKSLFSFCGLSIPMLTTSCGILNSVIEYDHGMNYLANYDYDTAIYHLEKSVRLFNRGTTHNSLAIAYLSKGCTESAWYHIKEAMLLNPSDELIFNNFQNIFQALLNFCGNTYPEITVSEVFNHFGYPDLTAVMEEKKEITFVYSYRVSIEFKEGKLFSIKWL
jgi:tetratricopeptide (TPR) repeat protein